MATKREAQKDPSLYEPHIGETRQYWRDIILGVNDGLVSMVLLVIGVVGAGLPREDVIITGVAGALAGASLAMIGPGATGGLLTGCMEKAKSSAMCNATDTAIA